MIEFINEKTGQFYRTYTDDTAEREGLDLYTFYFDDSQSTGLFYQKRLFFVSDKSSIVAKMPTNDVFFFYDLSSTPITEPIKLKNIKKTEVSLIGSDLGNTVTSDTYSDLYLYCLNIGCKSEVVGDFSINFTIDSNEYKIHSSFWGQQENLEILLQNQGVNLPYDIQRAIYETNVHTRGSSPDWITLNKKYKELLLNSVEILFKKGSYGSLIKSLDWFEWGQLAHLHEYWNRTESQERLCEQALTIDYNDTIKELMSIYKKTTFVSISVPREELHIEGNYVKYNTEGVYDECTVPILDDIQMKWGYDDIVLKLTLLGNYYSTFFMPLHMDLLYAAIEDIAMCALKLKNTVQGCHRSDIFHDLSYGESLVAENIDDIYYITDCTCRGKGKVVDISGMKIYDAVERDLFLGQGALFKLNLRVLTTNNTFHNDYNKVVLKLIKTSNTDNTVSSQIDVETPVTIDKNTGLISVVPDPLDPPHNDTGIYVFIKSPGKYQLGINLFSDTGAPLMLSVYVTVSNSNNRGFNIYQLISKTAEEIAELNDDFDYLAYPENSMNDKPDNKLYYPDDLLYSVSGCYCVDESSTICLYNSMGLVKKGNIDTIKSEIDNIPNSVLLEKDVYEYDDDSDDSGTKVGTMLYLVRTNKTQPTDEYYIRSEESSKINSWTGTGKDRKVKWFWERRFLPFLYKRKIVQNPADYLNLESKEAIFEYSPVQKYDSGADNVWTFTNEKTQESCVINGQLSPIVCGNNIISHDMSGYLSVSLKNSLGTFTRKCFAKIAVPVSNN